MTVSNAITAEQERALYLEGVRLFNSHQFFEAHEAWEDIWRSCTGVKREYLQGLIQCAVALEHYRRGNARGAMTLYGSYQKHFATVPRQFMGLDLATFLTGMKSTLQPLLDLASVPDHGELTLDPATAPQLVLRDDYG